MCGIAGFIDKDISGPQAKGLIQSMVGVMTHRGPDDQGYYSDGPLSMGMCRLSIVDVSGGHQPFSNENGSVTAICNGEIYNQGALRESLLQQGHQLKSKSDVEVIPHLYEQKGIEFVKDLRGMFGFAVWDQARQSLILGRDRLGIKPLFYAETSSGLIFASEIKCLLKSDKVSQEMNWNALGQYFNLGYIPSPFTIYKQIQKLEPGHTLVWQKGKIQIERYWELTFSPDVRRSEAEFENDFLALFKETVKMHLMSDVPLGAFLSGGIDSGLVVALMSEFSSKPVQTFTMGFGGNRKGYLDERTLSKQVSERYNTDHVEFEVKPDLTDIIDDIVQSFDEPFGDDSVIPSYYICKLTRQKVKVALSGLGGDELFGGYERYLGLQLSGVYDKVPGFVRRGVISPLVNMLPELKSGHYTINHMKRFVRAAELKPSKRYQEYVSVFNQGGRDALLTAAMEPFANGDYFDSPNALNLLDKALYQDACTYLPEDILALSDRLSMRHSLELRVPFVDDKVFEFCATIPADMKIKGQQKKYLLRKIAKKYLPDEIFSHRKQGFASPMAAWLRTDLREYVQESLSQSNINKHGILNFKYVQGLIDQHQTRRELNDRKIFAILMFQKWCDAYL